MSVPSNLIPTTITQLPEYTGSGTGGYMPYVIDGRTYKVLFSNIASVGAVPASRVIAAGTGLTGGGSLAADRVIAIANGGVGFDQLAASGATAGTYGSGTTVPVLTVDVKGRVTAATTTPVVVSGFVPEGRSVIAGTGLTGGGTLTSNVTLAVNFASSDPQALGTATAGVSTAAARGDHVHPAVNLSDTSQTQGALPLGRGGTGDALSPVAGAVVYSTGTRFALTALGLPGQVLVSNGTSAPSWLTVSGVGTVTSVNVSGGTTGLTFTGGPITSAGTITAGGTLGVANGGTGTGTAFTSGSLVFAGSAGVYSQDNANLFWDDTNNRLGVGTAAPGYLLQVGSRISLGSDGVIQWGALTGTSRGFLSWDTNIASINAAANLVLASNGTSERMRITSTGNVGIGTSSPAVKLDISGEALNLTETSANLDTFRVLVNSGGAGYSHTYLKGQAQSLATYVNPQASNYTINGNVYSAQSSGVISSVALVLGAGTSERMRVTSTGNVGIGTTSPVSRLHVAASDGFGLEISPSNAGYVNLQAYNRTGSAFLPFSIASSFIAFQTNGTTERMRITSGGDVGVGTTSPGGLLGIAGSTVIGNQATTGTDGTLRLVAAGGVTFIQSGQNRTTASAAPLAFTDMNGSSEWMRLTATGNLGIGITAPGSRLDVAGALMVNGTLSTGQTNKAAFQYGSNETSIRSYGATANSGFITFRTGGGGSDTERMRITPTGLVGIGATPSASRLEVNGSISNTLGSGGTLTLYETDATRANQLITAADASGSYLNATFSTGGSAVLRLQTAGTERLRVKANGQVRFVPLAAAPGSPEAGDVYYDSTTNKLRCYNGTTWNDLF
jgi:hypothetical protein